MSSGMVGAAATTQMTPFEPLDSKSEGISSGEAGAGAVKMVKVEFMVVIMCGMLEFAEGELGRANCRDVERWEI
jgi:hypothetical protein